jgi:transcriptional regulator with XRE-family HTH domain
MAGAAARLAPSSLFVVRERPGERLRSARLARDLTMRDVVAASKHLAVRFENQAFRISRSHLSEIEVGRALPGLYRLCSLAMIYELDLLTLASWFIPELADASHLSPEEKTRILSGFPDNFPRSA